MSKPTLFHYMVAYSFPEETMKLLKTHNPGIHDFIKRTKNREENSLFMPVEVLNGRHSHASTKPPSKRDVQLYLWQKVELSSVVTRLGKKKKV